MGDMGFLCDLDAERAFYTEAMHSDGTACHMEVRVGRHPKTGEIVVRRMPMAANDFGDEVGLGVDGEAAKYIGHLWKQARDRGDV